MANSDGVEFDLWVRWPKSSEVHTDLQVAINALDNSYNHYARTQSPRLHTNQITSSCRWTRARTERQEQRTQHAPVLATYHTRLNTKQQQLQQAAAFCSKWVIVWDQMFHRTKYPVKRDDTSLPARTRVSQRRLGCSSPGPREVRSAWRHTCQ